MQAGAGALCDRRRRRNSVPISGRLTEAGRNSVRDKGRGGKRRRGRFYSEMRPD